MGRRVDVLDVGRDLGDFVAPGVQDRRPIAPFPQAVDDEGPGGAGAAYHQQLGAGRARAALGAGCLVLS